MSRKSLVILGLVFGMIAIAGTPAMAQSRPIQLSLVTPIQIFPEDNPIAGFRYNFIYGRSVSVTGLDMGLANHTTGNFKGAQFGVVGLTDGDFVGWQDNAINVVRGDIEGLQWGIVNYANYANGLQLGFVNYAVSMKGLQIGLVNIIKQGGQFPVFPIVNWSF
jgi:hypothetical protein